MQTSPKSAGRITGLMMILIAIALLTATAIAQSPGTPGTPLTEALSSPPSDQKPGSILFYNYYTSSTTNLNESTTFSITNTSTVQSVLVHLFFVEGRSCSVRDFYVCLTRNQKTSFKAEDFDPDTAGYLLAVATDGDGCPINWNFLIGDEYIRTIAGYQANLGAEAIAAIVPGVPTTDANGDTRNRLPGCSAISSTATLDFGATYNVVPLTLALDNVSNVTNTDTLMIINCVGGDLTTTAASLGPIFGLLYDDIERQLSWSFTSARCQVVEKIGDSFPSTAPRFSSFITRTGWLKFYHSRGRAMFGAVLTRARTSAGYNGGHNLHKLTYNTFAPNNSYIIPVFPNSCNQAIL